MAGPVAVSAVELSPATRSLEAKLKKFEEFCKIVFPEPREHALWDTYRTRKNQAISEIVYLLGNPSLTSDKRMKAETEYVDKLNDLLRYLKNNISAVVGTEGSMSKFLDRTNELLYCIVTLARDPHAVGNSVKARQWKLWNYRRVKNIVSEIEDMCKQDKAISDLWKAWKETYTEYGEYMRQMNSTIYPRTMPMSQQSLGEMMTGRFKLPKLSWCGPKGCTFLVNILLTANGLPPLPALWCPTLQIKLKSHEIPPNELVNHKVAIALYFDSAGEAYHAILGYYDESRGRFMWVSNLTKARRVGIGSSPFIAGKPHRIKYYRVM